MKNWIERKNIQVDKEIYIPQHRESNIFDKLFQKRTKVIIDNNNEYTFRYKYGSLENISIDISTGKDFTDSDYMTNTLNVNKYYKSECFDYKNNSKTPYLYSIFIVSYSKYYNRITEKWGQYFLNKSGEVIGPSLIREKGYPKNKDEKFVHKNVFFPNLDQFYIGVRLEGNSKGIVFYKKEYDESGFLINHYQYCKVCGKLIFEGLYDDNNKPIFNKVCSHDNLFYSPVNNF